MLRQALVISIVVGVGVVAAGKAEKKTTSSSCSGWRMHGLPSRVHDVAAGGGKAWMLTSSGLYRWTRTCGWELRNGEAGAPAAPLWVDDNNQPWLYRKWEGHRVCTSSPNMHAHCELEGGGESTSRFDDETGAWIEESERPAEMPASRPAPSVPAITEKSPDSQLLAMAEDGDRAWVVATRKQQLRQKNGGWSTVAVPELWERATRKAAWTVRQPVSIYIGAAQSTATEAIDRLVVEGKQIYAGTDAGVAMRLDGDTWVAAGDNLRDSYSPLTGMAVFDGVPWLANTCEVTRHPEPQTLETKLAADKRCGIEAMWGRATDDVWVIGREGEVKRFDGGTWTALAKPPSSSLRAVWAAGADDAWVGGTTLLHWDGSTWTEEADGLAGACSTTRSALHVTALGGTGAKDVWAVGSFCDDGPFAAHWDGTSWTLRTDGFTRGRELEALVVRGKNDVYAVGHGVHHWNGKKWKELPPPSAALFRSVAVTRDSLWVGDQNGTIYQRSL